MKTSRFHDLRQYQSGAVLLVSLILLVLLTLFAIAAMNFTNIQSRIAGNLQVRNELKVVTQQAIEQVISSNFTVSPLPTDVYFDVNSDGKDDYKVTVTHECVSALNIPRDQLIITEPDDASCTITQSVQNSGIAIPPSTASLCSNTIWDVIATGTDDPVNATFKTAATVTTHQGIGIRVAAGTGC